jgi:hypothetical protein
LPERSKVTTRYKRKFLAQGMPINFVQFVLPN